MTGVYTTRSLDSSCCQQTDDGCCDKKKEDCCASRDDCCKPKGHGRDGRKAPMIGAHSSIHVEQIRERIIKDDDEEPSLADLIPVPKADPPYPPEAFCRIKDKGLLITVKNQGAAGAAASITEVMFTRVNVSVLRPTPALAPTVETDLHFPFPPNGCTGGFETCPFRITVDHGGTVPELNEVNNVALGSCLFLQ